MMKETWRDRILRLMKERGLNQKQLARAAGLGETAVRDILKERSLSPRLSTLEALAPELGVSLEELISGPDPAARKIPLIGFVSAGDGWTPFEGDGPVDYIDLTISGGELGYDFDDRRCGAVAVAADALADVYDAVVQFNM